MTTVHKEQLVVEDMSLGFGSVTQVRGVGTKINAENIPYTLTENVKQALDSRVSSSILTNYALVNGDGSTQFSVADGTNPAHAVSVTQLGTKANQSEVALKAYKVDVLELDNNTPYIPTYAYNPATKDYVDVSVYNLRQESVLKTNAQGAALIPAGSTALQPGAPQNGYFRLDTTTNLPVMYINGAWYKFTITPV